jgi:hypothetical protein
MLPDIQSDLAAPVSLREALCRLPLHARALWGNHSETVVAQARWDVAWILILLLVLVRVGFGLMTITHFSARAYGTLGSFQAFHMLEVLFLATLLQVVLAPAGILLLMALQFALAQAWHGQATFLGQSYSFLLFFVPLSLIYSLINSVLASLPGSGSSANLLLALAGAILTMLLNTAQLQRIHRLSVGKALTTVLISSFVLTLLAVLGAATLLGLLFAPLHAGAW